MRPLMFLLAAVLILGMTALATAGDCPGGVCPLEKNATALPSITINVPVVAEVAASCGPGTVRAVCRPARLLKAVVKNTKTRKPARKLVARSRRVLKLPLRGLCRRR